MDGGCRCGAARYRLKGNPLIVHACYCRNCQRETGSVMAVDLLYEADRVRLLQGKVAEVTLDSGSGNGQIISSCPTCNTTLWSVYNGMGSYVRFIKAGTTDAPDRYRPDIHIFTRSKPKWMRLPEDAPAVPEFYNLRDVWTGQSLNRLKDAWTKAEATES
ncbi:GFA family protein [Halovulum sp. GXIMD14793]